MIKVRRKLDPHQKMAFQFIRERDGQAGIFMAPGTGKTVVGVRYGQLHTPVLVVCRRDDFFTWLNELDIESINTKKVLQIDCGEDAIAAEAQNEDHDWTIVTYDLTRNPDVKRYLMSRSYGLVIADEEHMIKRIGSERTRAVIMATRHIPKRIALTGTPITNEILDVFSECLFIDDGKLFGTREWDFKKKYYIQSGPGWYVRREAKTQVAEKLKQIAFSVHEDDVLKLPPIRRLTKSAKMTPEQFALYDKVLNDWELELENGEIIEYDHVIVQLAKLKQIASGFYYKPDGTPHWVKSGKLDLLHELYDDPEYMGKKPKIVTWCAHTAEIEKIASTVKSKCVTFFGSDRKQKEAARAAFRDNPKIRHFIGQVDAGVGMNELIVADTSVYFSNSFKVVSRQQSMRRTRRKGSEIHRVITYYDLVSEGAVDVGIFSSISRMMDFATEVLKKLKGGARPRQILIGS